MPIRDAVHDHPFQTQAGRVYHTLRDMIFSGELKPGQPLPIEPAAEHLGVSIKPLRAEPGKEVTEAVSGKSWKTDFWSVQRGCE